MNLEKIFGKVASDKVRAIPDKARVIETAKRKGRLLAVKGQFDYVEKVIPHCYAGHKQLVTPDGAPPDPRQFDVMFVGCPGRVPPGWHAAIRSFVEQGGILLTTDWCLANLVAKVFPGYIHNAGAAQGQFPLRVADASHPLLDGLADCNGTPWLVETASHRIGIDDPKAVHVVLDAPALGEPASVLVTFTVGKGMVVHAISHFHLQGSDQQGEYVSAYILTNVIDEAVRRRHMEGGGRVKVVATQRDDRPRKIRILGSE